MNRLLDIINLILRLRLNGHLIIHLDWAHDIVAFIPALLFRILLLELLLSFLLSHFQLDLLENLILLELFLFLQNYIVFKGR